MQCFSVSLITWFLFYLYCDIFRILTWILFSGFVVCISDCMWLPKNILLAGVVFRFPVLSLEIFLEPIAKPTLIWNFMLLGTVATLICPLAELTWAQLKVNLFLLLNCKLQNHLKTSMVKSSSIHLFCCKRLVYSY